MNKKFLTVGIVFMFMLGFLLSPAALSHASGEVYINDEIGALSKQELSNLQAMNTKHEIKLHVQITDTLGSKSIGKFSNQLFSEWNLGQNDALLVIADSDGEVWLELNEQSRIERALYSAKDLDKSDPVLSFLEDYFYPQAAAGNYYAAIEDTMDGLDFYFDAYNQNAGAGGIGESKEAGQGTAVLPSIIIVAVVVLAGTVIVILARRNKRNRTVQLLLQIEDHYEKISEKLQNLDSDMEEIKKFSMGKSREIIGDAEDELYDLLQQMSLYPEKIRAWKSLNKAQLHKSEKDLQELGRSMQQIEHTIAELQEAIDKYKSIEAAAIKMLEESKQSFAKGQQAFQKLKVDGETTLQALFEREAELAQVLKEIESTLAFNPIEASKRLNGEAEKIGGWTDDVLAYEQLLSALHDLPGQIEATKRKLEMLISSESLSLQEISPYQWFDSMNGQLLTIERSLKVGDIPTARECANRIENWLNTALTDIKRTIAARDGNIEHIAALERDILSLKASRMSKAQQALELVKRTFADVHWLEADRRLQQLPQQIAALEEQVKQAAQYNDKQVQRYLEAEGILQAAQNKLNELEAHCIEIEGLNRELETNAEQYKQRIMQAKSSFQHVINNLQRHRLSMNGGMNDVYRRAEQISKALEQQLLGVPIKLTGLNEQLKYIEQYYEQFCGMAEQAIAEKQARERAEQERLRQLAQMEMMRRMANKNRHSGGGFGGPSGGSRGSGGSFRSGGGSRGSGGSFRGGGGSRGGGGKFK